MDPLTVLGNPRRNKSESAKVRKYNHASDHKTLRFMIGMSKMEPSHYANFYTFTSLPILLFSLLVTHLLITYGHKSYPPTLLYLLKNLQPPADFSWITVGKEISSLITVIIIPPMVLLVLFEFRNREIFESEMQRSIGEEDLLTPSIYYNVSNAPGLNSDGNAPSNGQNRSGLWVLEHGGKLLGAISLDGRKPTQCLSSKMDYKLNPSLKNEDLERPSTSNLATTEPNASVLKKRTTKNESDFKEPRTVLIRRFAADPKEATAFMEDSLFKTAIDAAFNNSTDSPPSVDQILFTLRPTVQRKLLKRLRKYGFKPLADGDPLSVPLDLWRKGRRNNQRFASVYNFFDRVWPLDLRWQTWVLKKEDWFK